MVFGAYLFEGCFYEICLITFTPLILTEMLNIFTELYSVHVPAIRSISASIIIYFLTIYFLPNTLVISKINLNYIPKILLLVSASWFPLYGLKLLMDEFDPSEHQKVMKNSRKRTSTASNFQNVGYDLKQPLL